MARVTGSLTSKQQQVVETVHLEFHSFLLLMNKFGESMPMQYSICTELQKKKKQTQEFTKNNSQELQRESAIMTISESIYTTWI